MLEKELVHDEKKKKRDIVAERLQLLREDDDDACQECLHIWNVAFLRFEINPSRIPIIIKFMTTLFLMPPDLKLALFLSHLLTCPQR